MAVVTSDHTPLLHLQQKDRGGPGQCKKAN